MGGQDAAGIVFYQGDSVLLHKRDYRSGILFQGYWQVFGGGIESGESPEETVVREMQEELGITISREILKPLPRVRVTIGEDRPTIH